MAQMPNAAETIERLAREAERKQQMLDRIAELVAEAESLDELRKKLNALTGKA